MATNPEYPSPPGPQQEAPQGAFFMPVGGKTSMKKKQYKDLYLIDRGVAFSSLQDAAQTIGPSFRYDLFVSPEVELEMIHMLKKLAAHTLDNPFAPHVNLRLEEGFGRDEWCLEANGKAVGSKGA